MLPASNILAADWSLTPQWAFNRWLVLLAVLLAGWMVVYLYRAQQKVASRRVVIALTSLRVVLVLLAFVLLAGLGVRWKNASASGGTLWLLVDRSGSMDRPDPQATPSEKLRWADALGLLPPEARPPALPRDAARLAALRAELAHLRTQGELAADPRDAASQLAQYARALRAWGDAARALADDLGQDPAARAATGDAPAQAVRSAAARMNDAADAVAKSQRRDAAGRSVPWDELQKSIDPALASLRALADAADQKFLADHAADPKVTEALAKVSKLTRAELAQLAFAAKGKPGAGGGSGSGALADSIARQKTQLVTFADAPHSAPVKNAAELSAALKPTGAAPTGQSTNLAAPLRYVAEQLAQDQPASIVLVSDGRDNSGGDLVEPARRLAARGARVFSLSLGSSRVAPDAAVEQVDAPDWVYQDDTVRAGALLRLDGLANKPVTVEFYRSGKKIDAKTVTPKAERASEVVSFSDKAPEPGVFEYDVRVADVPDEATKENNRLATRVAVKKDKLAVLLVEDMPRWEYRHLVNYLSRDTRVKLQTVLLQPARAQQVQRPQPVRANPKNEATEAQLLPEKKEDWGAFDLVILGDVPREALSDADQQNLAWAVKDRGAALLLIAGPFNMPQRFAGTPLADLVPVELTGGEWATSALPDHLKKGFRPTIAPEGQSSVLSQFTIDEGANAALWSALPAWYWHSEQTQAKRSASVIWSIGDLTSSTPAPTPTGLPTSVGQVTSTTQTMDSARERALLATMSVGMGRVMYLAGDATWRLRQVNGQNPHERFWGQVIRWVVNNELPAGGKLARFGTDKPRYVAGDPVVVTARLVGPDYAPLLKQKVRAVARAGGSSADGTDGKVVAQTDLAQLPDAPGYYRATLSGVPAGTLALSLEGDAVKDLLAKDQVPPAQRSLAVDVQSQLSVEQKNVNADRTTLARVAEAGGGIALDGPDAAVLAEHLPDLNYKTENTEQFALFADPGDRRTRLAHWAFLALFAAVATAEWVLRKAAGLV